MLKFTVNTDRCTRCGACVGDCPSRIIERMPEGVPFIPEEKEERCIECQHCLAICPSAAISIFGLDPDKSRPISADLLPRFEQMEQFIRSRRSIRRYENANVDPELIVRLLRTVANAPSGVNSRGLTFTVIDDRHVMQRLRERSLRSLAQAISAGQIPEQYAYLHAAVPAYFERQTDIVFRGAPHLIIISASPDTPCRTEDVPLALAYFELLAQSAGLGTVWCGLFKMLAEVLPEVKELVGLSPADSYYAMLFGYPAVHYARTVQRDDAARIRRVKLPQ